VTVTQQEIAVKSAQLYFRKKQYFINPLLGSQGGEPCLFSPPVQVLSEDATPAMLGQALQMAIDASHQNAPWPTDWKGLLAPLLVAAGVKHWASFAKGARSIRVDEDGGQATLLPSTSKVEKNAFTPFDDDSLVVHAEAANAAALGAAAVLAIQRSD
jgi:hypothetical protein